jgi:hypothetical protein
MSQPKSFDEQTAEKFRQLVEETVDKGFKDDEIDHTDREVLQYVSEFVNQEPSRTTELAIGAESLSALPPESLPGATKLIDFSIAFDGETSREIVRRQNNPILGSPEGREELSRRGVAYLTQVECYKAFCLHDKMYATEVETITTNANRIVQAIALVVAAAVGGVPGPVVAAIVAAALWLVAKIGVRSYCIYYSQFLAPPPDA